MKATYVVGDALAVLPTLDPGSVDLVICSPPFLALRSYLASDHPDKALEHGSEPTPAAFLAQLLDVTELLSRVLAPHGSIAVELGDTYSGGGNGPDAKDKHLAPHSSIGRWTGRRDGWPNDKSLCFVPSLYGASLAYGRNLLALPGTPEWREFAPWRVRNLIAWVRPNPPVGALGDKWRPATSYITVATRSATRYWDDIPTRKELAKPEARYTREGDRKGRGTQEGVGWGSLGPYDASNSAGAPLLDWWEITPTGFTSRLGAHYATFPDAIAIPLVEAMCPRRVCRTCGTPSRRLVDATRTLDGEPLTSSLMSGRRTNNGGKDTIDTADGVDHNRFATQRATVGWSTCGCPGTEQTREDGFHDGDGWRPGLVLDPYAGTGTTLLVATGHGRDAIGVDLDGRNAALAEERIGFFLTIKEPAA